MPNLAGNPKRLRNRVCLPLFTTPRDWKWKASNFVRWAENGLLETHESRVKFLAEEYDRIYQQGVSAGYQWKRELEQL